MLLCLVKAFFHWEFGEFGFLLRGGQDRMSRFFRRARSYQVTEVSRVRERGPGRPADRSKASTGGGSRVAGQAAPGAGGVSRRRAGGGRPRGRRNASGSG